MPVAACGGAGALHEIAMTLTNPLSSTRANVLAVLRMRAQVLKSRVFFQLLLRFGRSADVLFHAAIINSCEQSGRSKTILNTTPALLLQRV
jgi:hypothetical protein